MIKSDRHFYLLCLALCLISFYLLVLFDYDNPHKGKLYFLYPLFGPFWMAVILRSFAVFLLAATILAFLNYRRTGHALRTRMIWHSLISNKKESGAEAGRDAADKPS